MEKKLKIDKFRTNVRTNAFQHLDIYWDQKKKKLKFNKEKIGSLRSDWMLRKYILGRKYNAYRKNITNMNVEEKHSFIKNRSEVRQRIYDTNKEKKEQVESVEREQIKKHYERKKTYEQILKNNYTQTILNKRNEIKENEKIIDQLVNEEMNAYNLLRNTLSRERGVDSQAKYDLNGCPVSFEFSKKDKLKVFDKNFIKTMRFHSKSLTTRKRSNSQQSKCSQKEVISMNNSCVKEKKNSMFDEIETYNSRK